MVLHRMALLLGPPSSGKTTLLLALAGKLDPELRVCSNPIILLRKLFFIQKKLIMMMMKNNEK